MRKLLFSSRSLCLLLGCLSLVMPALVRADMIELINGDHYRGSVLGMTASNVDFLSEIQGRVLLPRAKVAQITLHDVLARAMPTANQNIAGSPPPEVLTTNTTNTVITRVYSSPTYIVSSGGSVPAAAPVDSVTEQMRQQGVDPKLVAQIQEQIFNKSSPEAAQKFTQSMGALMSGSLSVKDIRAQAQSSIAQIKAAKQDLGPDAADMLDGYLTILQQFVQESSSDDTIVTPQTAAVTPKK